MCASPFYCTVIQAETNVLKNWDSNSISKVTAKLWKKKPATLAAATTTPTTASASGGGAETAAAWAALQYGGVVRGVVSGHAEYGVFVSLPDIGAVQGLVHRSQVRVST